MSEPMIVVEGLSKTFTLHVQGGAVLPVLAEANLCVAAGECVALHGASGAGKSTLLRTLYGNYLAQTGSVRIRHGGQMIDLVGAAPHQVLALRRATMGYVSQFLRAIPRVPAIEIVGEPLRALGVDAGAARDKAAGLLKRLRIPQSMWNLAPATFSGGEQQRVNIARGFVVDYPVLLLDEPTASLDAANRQTVVDLILEAKARGAAIVGIFHDADVRNTVADTLYEMKAYEAAA